MMMIEMVVNPSKQSQHHNVSAWLKPLLLAITLSMAPHIHANSETKTFFKGVPDRCISLHKGQTCYQKVILSWESPVTADFCLFRHRADQPLKCWTQVSSGVLELDFQSSTPLTYHLYQTGKKEPIASSTVSVAWVYKTPKRQRGGWRLF